MITSAFTCTGPYAILIMLGIKRVENRSAMPVPSKGRCAVSCSKSFCKEEFGRFVAWAAANLAEEDFARMPSWGEVKDWPGKVVGCCDYEGRLRSEVEVECGGRRLTDIPWDEGCAYWWNLSNVACLDQPIACRGNVGMWQMDAKLAARVSAADELAASVGEKIATAKDAERLFRLAIPLVGGNEGFFVLPLDDARQVLSEPILVSLGDPTTTVIQPSEVFGIALKAGASSIIVAHNHPSGNLTPSIQDRELTASLVALGNQLGTKVLDHIITGGDEAFRDRPRESAYFGRMARLAER